MTETLGREERNQIGNTIFGQLGGNRFKAMVGASSFTIDENSALAFRFRGSRWTSCIIALTPLDLYTMTFIRVNRKFEVEKKEVDMVYCDQLCDVFESVTGLRTSL